jgi:hypothetical protein
MKKVKAIIRCLLITNFLLAFSVPSAYCKDFQKAAQEKLKGGVWSEYKSTKSFFHRVLSGKYNLLEEDFSDVPHRTTRYDYIKEAMEDIRPYSRPDEDEFAILNLQWKDGTVFLNDFKTVLGKVRKRRGFFIDRKTKFFYRLFSDKKTPVYEDYFDVPLKLHFDFLDEETWELAGGAINRSEADFIVKIPLYDKSAQKIIFYKQRDLGWIKGSKVFREEGYEDYDLEEVETVIGETLF